METRKYYNATAVVFDKIDLFFVGNSKINSGADLKYSPNRYLFILEFSKHGITLKIFWHSLNHL